VIAMNKPEFIAVLFLLPLISLSSPRVLRSQPAVHTPDDPAIRYTGRIDFGNPKRPRLIGAGAYIEVKFKGTACELMLEEQNSNTNHGYVSVAIDGQYRGRIRIDRNRTDYPIANDLKDTVHTLLVCKATEAMIGCMDFLGIRCGGLLPLENRPKRKIEFIGDSITSGTGLDASEVPCDSGAWYDQQNAWLTYGALTARACDADWLLSSVSGIGISRNWNSPGPTMPDVYDHEYLNGDSTSRWKARAFDPDLVSVCLGTNDFSDGDGIHQRAPLDSAKFVDDTFRFIRRIRNRYPRATICCLTSPVLAGANAVRLSNFLSVVIRRLRQAGEDEKVRLFAFSKSFNHGCTGHPNMEEHRMMSEELAPFFRKTMDWQ
jgi:lysophospholipase L1-like esterase